MEEEKRNITDTGVEPEETDVPKPPRKTLLRVVLVILGIIVIAVMVLLIYIHSQKNHKVEKPVIYLYPEQACEVKVLLDLNGKLTTTYPKYENGWRVTAEPDGTLTDAAGKQYYCLYWEGDSDVKYDMSEGFCVKGSDTATFLEDALAKLGLTEREANEFIIYWLPRMEGNAYNVISFQSEAYTENAKLRIDPEPDTLIRVFMTWYGSEKAVEMKEQTLSAPERSGFTVVEWGGSEIR